MSTLDGVLTAFSGCSIQKAGEQKWMAKCPAHEDGTASLSVGVGDDGGVLLHCYASCETEAVVAAVGLTMKDLMPEGAQPGRQERVVPAKGTRAWEWLTGERKLQAAAAEKVFATQGLRGELRVAFPYRDAAGEITYYKTRTITGVKKFGRFPVRKQSILFGLDTLVAGDAVLVTEGEMDQLSLSQLGLPCVSLPDGANSVNIEKSGPLLTPLSKYSIVYVATDSDDPGDKAAAVVAAILGAEKCLRVRFGEHKDANDALKAGWTETEFRAAVAAAEPMTAAVTPLPIFDGPDEDRMVDEAIAALVTNALHVYQRAGQLVEIIKDQPKTRGVKRVAPIVRIRPLEVDRMSEILSRVALWLRPNGVNPETGEERPPTRIHPPVRTVRQVLARGTWRGIRPLVGVATAATLREDGSLLSTAGYDSESAMFMAPGLSVTVPDAPTSEDAKMALAMLLDLLRDFPATGPAKAAWIAGLLTVVCRPAIVGCTPMMLIEAAVRGSGKSLLADVASVIATGEPAPRMSYTADDDAEVRKVLTSIAITGDASVLLDNIEGQVGSPSLDRAITSDVWKDRVLGRSEIVQFPWRTVLWATGNSLIIAADLARRCLLVRLVPTCERPEERDDFKYPRLIEHVRANRSALLSAALTIVRAYVVAGKPNMNLSTFGSFEVWSDVVRAALVWTGGVDPLGTVVDVRRADTKAEAVRDLLAAWPLEDGSKVSSKELVRLAFGGSAWRDALDEFLPPRSFGDLPTAHALGQALMKVRDQIIDGMVVRQSRDSHSKVAVWHREKVQS